MYVCIYLCVHVCMDVCILQSTPSSVTAGSEFGYSVSMSGQYFVAGAPGFDADAGKCVMELRLLPRSVVGERYCDSFSVWLIPVFVL
jgi:hypothetical protein